MAACMTASLLSVVVLMSLCWLVVCVVEVVVTVTTVVVVTVLEMVDVDVIVKVVEVKVVVVNVDVGTNGANFSGFMETAAMPSWPGSDVSLPKMVVMALINPSRNDGE